MASKQQVVANRANAKRSTGPKTAAGKALSRMNAHKHGLTAKTIVIGDEDPKAFDALRDALEEEYNPRPGIESELVELIAVLMWRMLRIPLFEAALINLGCERAASYKRKNHVLDFLEDPERKEVPFEDIANSLIQNQGMLGNLSRYEATLMNAFNRTLQRLLFLQDRRAREEDESQVVEILPSPSVCNWVRFVISRSAAKLPTSPLPWRMRSAIGLVCR